MEGSTSTSGESNHLQQCPVCSQEYPSKAINKHVNECLNVLEEKPGRKETRKRKAESAWGSLHPQQDGQAKKRKGKSPSAKSNSKNQTKKKNLSQGSCDPKLLHIENEIESDPNEAKTDDKTTEDTTEVTWFSKEKTKSEQAIDISIDMTEENTLDKLEQKRCISLSNSTPKNDDKNSKTADSSKTYPSSGQIGNMILQRQQNVPVFGASNPSSNKKVDFAPLAEKMRPQMLDDYVGQDASVGRKSMLRSLLQGDKIPSMVLWGPPGCGKVYKMYFFYKYGTSNLAYR